MNRLVLPMQTVEVNSTAIERASYKYENYRLTLTFDNGGRYHYEGVPNHVFEGLRSSQSKGKFINKYVLPFYTFNYAD